jgi:hypothetical protein
MTAEQFKVKWSSIEDNLSQIPFDILALFELSPATCNFLNKSGLPNQAAPFLSFCNATDDKFHGINKLTYQYDFLEPYFEKYIVIGSCNDGDPIVINTEKNDQIECLDHDDYFSPSFFNTSIYTLAHSLLAFRDFIFTIERENGEEAVMNNDFTDSQFETLKNDLLSADEMAVDINSFWYNTLQMELEMREDNKQ